MGINIVVDGASNSLDSSKSGNSSFGFFKTIIIRVELFVFGHVKIEFRNRTIVF